MSGGKPRLPSKCPVSVCFKLSGEAILLYCKRWSCPHCARTLARKWAQRAVAAFGLDEHGKPSEQWFLTLTLSSYYRTPEQGFTALPKLWDTTRKAFQRLHKGWTYLAFVEGQPERDHMPHFHILSVEQPPAKLGRHRRITKRTLHDWAVSLGWGFEVELKPVNSNGAAFYVAKYASKGSPAHPQSFRRVRCSRDWPKPVAEPIIPIIRRKKAETLDRYLVRVAAATGQSLSQTYARYWVAHRNLAQILEIPYTKV